MQQVVRKMAMGRSTDWLGSTKRSYATYAAGKVGMNVALYIEQEKMIKTPKTTQAKNQANGDDLSI